MTVEKFPLLGKAGETVDAWLQWSEIHQVGPYQVWMHDQIKSVIMIICSPLLRKPLCWNATRYFVRGDNLEPEDDDVVPDPYHMGLIYQLYEELKSKEKGK
jgi:hypothetical protein